MYKKNVVRSSWMRYMWNYKHAIVKEIIFKRSTTITFVGRQFKILYLINRATVKRQNTSVVKWAIKY
jgi:hypothetical protein